MVVHAGRCWASVARSLVLKGDTPAAFFEKQYFAAYSLGRLKATLSSMSFGLPLRIFTRN
jgi:hypothetical protein